VIFIDANIFIRYFVPDNLGKSKKVEALFRKIVKGEIECFTNIYRNSNIDFIDAYNYSYILANNAGSIFSYDSYFDKLESIIRIEP
jgi:predicted nucleic acid-binding protein